MQITAEIQMKDYGPAIVVALAGDARSFEFPARVEDVATPAAEALALEAARQLVRAALERELFAAIAAARAARFGGRAPIGKAA